MNAIDIISIREVNPIDVSLRELNLGVLYLNVSILNFLKSSKVESNQFRNWRFVNKLGNHYERSMAIIKQGDPALCITDSDGAKHSLRKDLVEMKPV